MLSHASSIPFSNYSRRISGQRGQEGQCVATQRGAFFRHACMRDNALSRLKKASNCPVVMPPVFRATVSFHRRDSATASNVFFLVAINQFQRSQDTRGTIALQEIHAVERGFSLIIRQMFEIPTDNQSNLFNGGDGDVAGVVRIVGCNHAGGKIRLRQSFRFRRQRQDLFGISESFGEKFLDFGRGALNFFFRVTTETKS